jgi:hypothetical protein
VNKNEVITILSTFAKDKIIDRKRGVISIKKRGPAFYLSNIFKKEKILFNLITPSIAEVEILITKNGEIGKVKKRPKIQKIDFSKIKTPFLVISTILNEFNLNNISSFQGKIFLDIQGYVRDGRKLGGKKFFSPSKEITSSVFCLKGTREELKYIPKIWLNQQKQKILVITKGKLGCEVFIFGENLEIKVKNKITTLNTIGAGDVFFAYIISKFLKTTNFPESIRYAVRKTTEFLFSKPRGRSRRLTNLIK